MLRRHREGLEAPHSGKGLAPLGPAPVGRRPVLTDGRLRVELQDVEPRSGKLDILVNVGSKETKERLKFNDIIMSQLHGLLP